MIFLHFFAAEPCHHLRMEMDEYRRLKRSLRVLKSYTDYEEDLYDEAV